MGSILAAIPRGVFAGQSLGDLPKNSGLPLHFIQRNSAQIILFEVYFLLKRYCNTIKWKHLPIKVFHVLCTIPLSNQFNRHKVYFL